MNIELSVRGLKALLDRITRIERGLRSPGTLKRVLGRKLVEQTKHRIEVEKQSPDGVAWRPWSPEYAATRGPQHSLLISSRRLLNSIRASVTKDGVAVTSDTDYAARQNAERPFLGVSADNREEIRDLVAEWADKL